jgi:type II secretory pathway pseudopilin PulG
VRRRAYASGFTLVELLIACTLLLLALTLAFGYLIPATRAAYRFRTRSHLQQSAVVVMSKIAQAASTTAPGGFGWSSGPDLVALSFNPLDDLQGVNAVLRWSEVFDLFWWSRADHTLRQRRWPPGPPLPQGPESGIVRAKRLTAARLAAVTGDPGGSSRILARGVTDFRIRGGGTGGELIQPVHLSITLVEEGRENDAQGAISVTHTLTFRLESLD